MADELGRNTMRDPLNEGVLWRASPSQKLQARSASARSFAQEVHTSFESVVRASPAPKILSRLQAQSPPQHPPLPQQQEQSPSNGYVQGTDTHTPQPSNDIDRNPASSPMELQQPHNTPNSPADDGKEKDHQGQKDANTFGHAAESLGDEHTNSLPHGASEQEYSDRRTSGKQPGGSRRQSDAEQHRQMRSSTMQQKSTSQDAATDTEQRKRPKQRQQERADKQRSRGAYRELEGLLDYGDVTIFNGVQSATKDSEPRARRSRERKSPTWYLSGERLGNSVAGLATKLENAASAGTKDDDAEKEARSTDGKPTAKASAAAENKRKQQKEGSDTATKTPAKQNESNKRESAGKRKVPESSPKAAAATASSRATGDTRTARTRTRQAFSQQAAEKQSKQQRSSLSNKQYNDVQEVDEDADEDYMEPDAEVDEKDDSYEPKQSHRAATTCRRSSVMSAGGSFDFNLPQEQPSPSSRWSKEQQEALMKAWREVEPTERHYWHKIAQRVPGKSATECSERFHEDDQARAGAHAATGTKQQKQQQQDAAGNTKQKRMNLPAAAQTAARTGGKKGKAAARKAQREMAWDEEAKQATRADDVFGGEAQALPSEERPNVDTIEAERKRRAENSAYTEQLLKKRANRFQQTMHAPAPQQNSKQQQRNNNKQSNADGERKHAGAGALSQGMSLTQFVEELEKQHKAREQAALQEALHGNVDGEASDDGDDPFSFAIWTTKQNM